MKRYTILFLAGCWDSPTPELPSGVDVLLTTTPVYRAECGDEPASYISDVAFGAGYIYAVGYRWFPPNDGDNCGNSMNQLRDVPVLRRPLPGTDGQPANLTAGSTMGSLTTRVAGNRSLGAWVHAPEMSGTSIEVYRDPGDSLTITNPTGGYQQPTGFVADDAYGFLVTSSHLAPLRDVAAPAYPAGSTSSQSSDPTSYGWRIDWSGDVAEPITIPSGMHVIADTLDTALVDNTTSVFVALRDSTDQKADVEVHAIDKEALASTKLDTVFRETGVPVGLDATDAFVAWTVSSFYPTEGTPPSPRCGLFLFDWPTDVKAERIYTSFEHDCTDVALDEAHAYFTITHADKPDQSPGAYGMQGLGLARVLLAPPHTFESIDLGTTTEFSGPRRVWIDGEYLIAADPFTVVRIRKNVLAGKTELFP